MPALPESFSPHNMEVVIQSKFNLMSKSSALLTYLDFVHDVNVYFYASKSPRRYFLVSSVSCSAPAQNPPLKLYVEISVSRAGGKALCSISIASKQRLVASVVGSDDILT